MKKEKYSTLYLTPYGYVVGELKELMTKEEAILVGKMNCEKHNYQYEGTFEAGEAFFAARQIHKESEPKVLEAIM